MSADLRKPDRSYSIRQLCQEFGVTARALRFYEDKGLLARIDGERSPDEVHDHIRATVATWRLEAEA